ncbi:MAG: hypothetical protein GEU98_14080 [Pseudonocardiaceae bacterium]|nr:hypothetical protein [Pseudonocardiaceae bacterium]
MNAGPSLPGPDHNYPAQSHEQLKSWVDQNNDPGGSQGVADEWRDVGQRLTIASELLKGAVEGSADRWTGSAAERMREAVAAYGKWSAHTGASAEQLSGAVGEQSSSAADARNRMPDPVPYEPGKMIGDAVKSGNILDIASLPGKMAAQKAAHDAAKQQAEQVVQARDTTLQAVGSNVQPFAPPPSLGGTGGDATTRKAQQVGGTEAHQFSASNPGTGTGSGGLSGAGSGAGGAGPLGSASGTGAGGGYPNAGGDSGSGYGGVPGGGYGGAPGSTGEPGTTTSAGYTGPGSGSIPGGFGPGSGGAGAGAPGGAGATGMPVGGAMGGFGAGGGSAGSAGRAGLGGGSGATTGQSPGTGAKTGSGAGAAGAQAVPGRGAAAGGTGGRGMPMGGAGRGQGGDDDEHQRASFLIEPDAEGTFGTDEKTAPPVIGE